MTSIIDKAAFEIEECLARADRVIVPSQSGNLSTNPSNQGNGLHVGVDLGTAYLVVVVLDDQGQPVAGEYQFAQVVRDGLVVDFIGATDLLQDMVRRVGRRIGRKLTHAASGFPPGVAQVEVRSIANVLEAAGLVCTGLIDEPSAANNVLKIRDGAIIDVGGGTTGIAVVKDGQVVYTADEATGGTHFSLVIEGALDIDFMEAEQLKKNLSEHKRLFSMIRPVMEKVASIVNRHIKGLSVDNLTLVGGTSSFPGMTDVVQEYTGLPRHTSSRLLLVTPIGIAMHD